MHNNRHDIKIDECDEVYLFVFSSFFLIQSIFHFFHRDWRFRTMTSNEKRVAEREALRSVIQQWNANRLDLFELSEPDEASYDLQHTHHSKSQFFYWFYTFIELMN